MAVSQWLKANPEGRTDEFIEEIPYRETRNYVRRVLGHWAVYAALYGGPAVVLPERLPNDALPDPSY
jgi:soluble lytic murein transglycosylase-like protein